MKRDPAEATSAPAGAAEAVDDDELPEPPFVHRLVGAAEAEPLQPRCPVSVFALAAVPIGRSASRRSERQARGAEAGEGALAVETCHRSGGVTKAQGLRYPSDRWTQEREERERARRARQRVPKPPKGAKSRSRKLLAAIGNNLWDK